MCFSAAASFTLAGVLTGVGVVSVARNESKPHRLLAVVPFLFAAQQVAEGVVWLTMPGGDQTLLSRVATTAFLAIALVLWPIWAPLSLRIVERSDPRRRALTGIAWLGVVVAAIAAFLLARWQPIAAMAGHSITYHFGRSTTGLVGLLILVAYAIPTVGPFFVSTVSLARTIGAALVVSLGIAALIERDATTSVWCFFAAVISVLVVVAVDRDRRRVVQPLTESE